MVWAVGLGALALLLAAFGSIGLAQADGLLAVAILLLYSPFYLLGHAFSPDAAGLSDAGFDASVFAAQFIYFLSIVATVRYLHRNRKRRKP